MGQFAADLERGDCQPGYIMAVYTVRDARIIDDATFYDRKTS